MSKKPDLIFFSITRWNQNNPGLSLSLSRELSRHYRLFFIERPYSIKDFFTDWNSFELKKRIKALFFYRNQFQEIQTGFSTIVVVTPALVLPLNFLPKGVFYNFLNTINSLIVKRSIANAIKKYHIHQYIYFNNFNPTLLPVLDKIKVKPILNIYYIINDINFSKYYSRHGARAQERAIQKTDLVLVSTRAQFKHLFNKSLNVYYFPNGVDFPFFNSFRNKNIVVPYDLRGIGQLKVIMFCGNVSSQRLDFLLLKAICENFPQYLIVLVGSYNDADLIQHKLEQMPNLIILGNRRFESIPNYLQVASVAIIPYALNPLNESVMPLKLSEYLSAGKPIVSTNFSQDLEPFSEVVYVSETYEDFLINIEKAIDEDNEIRISNRIKYAMTNSWEVRVNQLMKIIQKRIKETKHV